MNILVADDHPLVRDGLARTVRRAVAGARVQEAGDFAAARALCGSFSPEMALLDLNMPGMDGLAGLRELQQEFPALRLIVASGQDDPATIRAVLAIGVHGFFPKSEPPDALAHAITIVRSGGCYVPRGALADWPPAATSAAPDSAGLTARQRDVLRLLQRGEPNKQIARELGLTEGTVKIHIAAILRVLQVRNRTEAVVRARDIGLCDDEP